MWCLVAVSSLGYSVLFMLAVSSQNNCNMHVLMLIHCVFNTGYHAVSLSWLSTCFIDWHYSHCRVH